MANISKSLVILNGPSRQGFLQRLGSELRIGCNYADLDSDLDHCVVIDRMTVVSMIDRLKDSVTYWVRKDPLPLPPRGTWRSFPAPGIDSGSLAVRIALELVTGPVYVVGADGVLLQDHRTQFEYSHRRLPPTRQIHQRHRQTYQDINKEFPGRIMFFSPRPDPDFETCSDENLFKCMVAS